MLLSLERNSLIVCLRKNLDSCSSINFVSDFSTILSGAERKPQEGVKWLIERAPECKSVFVSGFSEDATKEQVETYFDNEVGALDPVRGVQINNHLWDEEKKHKRAIVYFKDKKSK